MSYTTEKRQLDASIGTYGRNRKKFYSTFASNPDNPLLDRLALTANQALDDAIELRTHISEEILRETPGYPKSNSRGAEAFDKTSRKVTELTRERKAKRRRRVFVGEGRQRVKKIDVEHADRMKQIRDRKLKTKEMIRNTPELAWWRWRGIKSRTGSIFTRNVQRGKAKVTKAGEKWSMKSRYGLGLHLIGRAKSRRIRKMKP